MSLLEIYVVLLVSSPPGMGSYPGTQWCLPHTLILSSVYTHTHPRSYSRDDFCLFTRLRLRAFDAQTCKDIPFKNKEVLMLVCHQGNVCSTIIRLAGRLASTHTIILTVTTPKTSMPIGLYTVKFHTHITFTVYCILPVCEGSLNIFHMKIAYSSIQIILPTYLDSTAYVSFHRYQC